MLDGRMLIYMVFCIVQSRNRGIYLRLKENHSREKTDDESDPDS